MNKYSQFSLFIIDNFYTLSEMMKRYYFNDNETKVVNKIIKTSFDKKQIFIKYW